MIHPTSDVQSNNIGENTFIWQYVVILPNAIIGRNCNINCHCFLENDVILGNNVTIKSGVYLWDGTSIMDNVFIGPNVTFVNNKYPRSKEYPGKHIGVTIRIGASIGAGSTLLGSIVIGEFAMVGAGSVVTKNIPRNTLWYGNPAKFQGYVCNCGHKLNDNLVCSQCSKEYIINNGLFEEVLKK
jgi:UDP-2-acetamido-3-amino-2,3-dideoxy-glucuronate N-acetyltransferase